MFLFEGEESSDDFDTVLWMFEEHFVHKVNVFYERSLPLEKPDRKGGRRPLRSLEELFMTFLKSVSFMTVKR